MQEKQRIPVLDLVDSDDEKGASLTLAKQKTKGKEAIEISDSGSDSGEPDELSLATKVGDSKRGEDKGLQRFPSIFTQRPPSMLCLFFWYHHLTISMLEASQTVESDAGKRGMSSFLLDQ